MTITDSLFFNSSSTYALVLFGGYYEVNFNGIVIEQSDAPSQFTFWTQRCQYVNIRNITLINNEFTGTGTNAILYMGTLNGGKLTLDGLYVQDSNLRYRDTLHFVPTGVGELSISNVYYENVTVNVDASLIRSQTANSIEIKDCKFNQVKQASPSDSTNVMINLGTLYLDSDGEFLIENITVTESSISLVEMGALANYDNRTKSITFSDISYTNSLFEFSQDLIIFGNIEFEHDFEMLMVDITMQNLTFERTGNLFKFQHQTELPVKVSNSYYTDIYGGSIFVGSANLDNTELKTKVEIDNMTAEYIDGSTSSFIHVNEGTVLTIRDSKFRYLTNNEGGAVINADYQNSITSFYNSTFYNNTALYGGVAIAQYGSVINFYD